MSTAHQPHWLQGFAAALASVCRAHDQPGHVVDAMNGYGITVADLRRGGVEAYDLDVIKKAMGQPLSQSIAARAERSGVSIDEIRRRDRENKRSAMSPAEKEDFDMGVRPRRK